MRKNSETMTNELVGIAVAKLRNKLHRLMKQRYMAEAEIQITVEEFMLLSMIEEKTDPILQSIALATGKNKSVVMRMIDSLERKGLARRTVNPDDRRENLLSITAEGEKVVARFRAIDRRLTEELFDGIPAEKITHFFEVVDELSRRAGSR